MVNPLYVDYITLVLYHLHGEFIYGLCKWQAKMLDGNFVRIGHLPFNPPPPPPQLLCEIPFVEAKKVLLTVLNIILKRKNLANIYFLRTV